MDRPDREKIAEFLAKYDSKCWLTMSLKLRECYKRKADQILALFPDIDRERIEWIKALMKEGIMVAKPQQLKGLGERLIEEARKQERKDVGLELQQWLSSNSVTSPYRYVDRVIEAIKLLNKGQALKEE